MDDKLLHLCSPGRKEAHNQQAAGKKKKSYIEITPTLYINKSAFGFGITEYRNVHSCVYMTNVINHSLLNNNLAKKQFESGRCRNS